MLWARQQERVLVVLQGIDTSGKGGTVQKVFGAGEARPACRVTSFNAPTEDELARDYLWRVHANVPAKGEIGVFDRSHYEDVLAVRVLELVPEEQWRRRYDHINDFERLLTDEGTTIVKVFLHISKDEQKARLQARLDEPTKRWKFKTSDLEARARWDDWETAFEEAIEQTSTEHAPWYVVPADKKWYRDWAVASIMVAVLERHGPRLARPRRARRHRHRVADRRLRTPPRAARRTPPHRRRRRRGGRTRRTSSSRRGGACRSRAGC